MLLAQLHVAGITNLDHLTLRLEDASGAPRRLVVLFGGEGVGKTSILAAVASTRPGHAIAQAAAPPPSGPGAGPRSEDPPLVAADWLLGDDDPTHDAGPAPKVPARPHPLRVVSPNAKLPGERDDAVLLRRREQALFDRRAAEGGFVLVVFSGARWFSRTPTLLTTPDRTVLRHDTRAAAAFDDATRADLARETKQVLAYAAISAALAAGQGLHAPSDAGVPSLDRALRDTLAVLLDGTGAAYLGTSARKLEPVFALGDREVELDDLPRSLRHRVAFGALTVRALAAAYPGRDPRGAEGVVLLDDLEVQQDGRALGDLPALLRRALPRVQWIVTTASPLVAAGCDVSEVLALRRMPGSAHVELHQGPEAVVH